MHLDSRPVRREGVLSQRVPDALVLLTPDDGLYFSLNDVGARVWELCDGQRRLAEVVSAVSAEFDAPTETVERDVLELVEELATESLLSEAR